MFTNIRLKRIAQNARWFWQRRTRGWDDREIWALNSTAAHFLAPRLELLRDEMCGYPFRKGVDEELWFAILDKMAQAFRLVDEDIMQDTARESEAMQLYIDEGVELFAEFFNNLWD